MPLRRVKFRAPSKCPYAKFSLLIVSAAKFTRLDNPRRRFVKFHRRSLCPPRTIIKFNFIKLGVPLNFNRSLAANFAPYFRRRMRAGADRDVCDKQRV